jgi:hypothetical protein
MMNTVRRSKQFALLAILAATPGWLPAAGWPLLTPGQVQSSPLLANLDGDTDGRLEIIVPSSDDKLYIQKHDGTPFTGSPFTLGFGDGTGSSVAVGNVDGTGGSEIVVYGDNADENGANLKVFGASGTLLCSASSGMSGSGRATPCLIDCYKYSSASATHPALEVPYPRWRWAPAYPSMERLHYAGEPRGNQHFRHGLGQQSEGPIRHAAHDSVGLGGIPCQ